MILEAVKKAGEATRKACGAVGVWGKRRRIERTGRIKFGNAAECHGNHAK